MQEAPKYTADEEELSIPCRVWLPEENKAILIDLMRIPAEAMTPEVLAHSLATKARYNGATGWPYSVAIHSILVSQLIDPRSSRVLMLEALLHDGSEAFVGDLIHPIKRKLPQFKEIENLVETQLRAVYDLPEKESHEVKFADTQALWLEQHFMQGKPFSPEAKESLTPRHLLFAQWACDTEHSWRAARKMFLIHYDILLGELSN